MRRHEDVEPARTAVADLHRVPCYRHADGAPLHRRARIGGLVFPACRPRTLREFYDWHPLDVAPELAAESIAGGEAVI
ncbi:hypothetical protein [Microbacterium sp. SORGH_AS_0888]|uniref:hypothetical protein n=1 Tax=Microbacterium sp. SORGH_AS_0888 TaxID=3041791 RepID=UPI0027898EC5|nr:hypothetical protein [Microbacterium sp. SORGH_AS_0888]MDQ1128672.1 hypothetical protein [Microbacterium sp. SORGH_AS_0888]